jgi:hypothetical protein
MRQPFFVLRELCVSAGREASEDRAGVVANAAWVIDGATQIENSSPLAGPSEGTWIVELIHAELYKICLRGYFDSLADLFVHLACLIRDELETVGYPKDRLPPAASLAIARLNADTIEVAIAGDVSVMFRNGGQPHRLCEKRFLDNERLPEKRRGENEKAAKHKRSDLLSRRRGYIYSRSGPFILSANPETVQRCNTITYPIDNHSSVVLASDGFMRLQDIYGDVLSIDEFIEAGDVCRLHELMQRLRVKEAQAKDADEHSGMVKDQDDAAALAVMNFFMAR